MSILVESITKIICAGKTVRVWRQENNYYHHDLNSNKDLREFVAKNEDLPVAELAGEVLKLPRVNAVEVLELGTDGVVFYSEWP